MNKNRYIVIIAPGCVVVVEMTPECEKMLMEEYDDDLGYYIACFLASEFGFNSSESEWMEVSPSDFYYTGELPNFQKVTY